MRWNAAEMVEHGADLDALEEPVGALVATVASIACLDTVGCRDGERCGADACCD